MMTSPASSSALVQLNYAMTSMTVPEPVMSLAVTVTVRSAFLWRLRQACEQGCWRG